MSGLISIPSLYSASAKTVVSIWTNKYTQCAGNLFENFSNKFPLRAIELIYCDSCKLQVKLGLNRFDIYVDTLK